MGTISSADIQIIKPELSDYLDSYNTLLASLLVRNFGHFKFLASATINRIEAQTHFYQKVERYLQIRQSLVADENLKIVLQRTDTHLFNELSREFGARVLVEKSVREFHFTRVVSAGMWWLGSLAKTMVLGFIGKVCDRPKKQYDYLIRTYFDFRCSTADGGMREEYFGPFADDLAKSSKVLVVFKFVNFTWDNLRLYLKIREKANWDSCLWESLLTPGSVIKCFMMYLLSHIKIKGPILYKDVDIAFLLQQSLDEDFFQRRGLNVYLERHIAQKAFSYKPDRIFMPYENQPWEKIYPLVRKEMKLRTAVIGFQHTGLSYKLLNYFPCRIECDLPVYPDMIFTVGEVFTRLLQEVAYYPGAIRTGAALRHYRMMVNGSFTVKLKTDNRLQRKIVYAFSYDLTKYREIVDVLKRAFAGTAIEVFLRFHPDYNENEVLATLGKLPVNFIPAGSHAWEEIYQSVDIVLYDDNSIGLEAMLHGVLTLLLDIENVYDCERMFDFNYWQTSISPHKLIELRNQLLDGSFANPYNASEVQVYLQNYYKPYSAATFDSFITAH